jgi:hypothetical protein
MLMSMPPASTALACATGFFLFFAATVAVAGAGLLDERPAAMGLSPPDAVGMMGVGLLKKRLDGGAIGIRSKNLRAARRVTDEGTMPVSGAQPATRKDGRRRQPQTERKTPATPEGATPAWFKRGSDDQLEPSVRSAFCVR